MLSSPNNSPKSFSSFCTGYNKLHVASISNPTNFYLLSPYRHTRATLIILPPKFLSHMLFIAKLMFLYSFCVIVCMFHISPSSRNISVWYPSKQVPQSYFLSLLQVMVYVPKLKGCFCMVSLRTGTLLIGGINIFGCIIWMLCGAALIFAPQVFKAGQNFAPQ